MPEPRINCISCGTSILEVTAKHFNGLCGRCLRASELAEQGKLQEVRRRIEAAQPIGFSTIRHSLRLKSIAAVIEDAHRQIDATGIDALISNGYVSDLYVFRDALIAIGSRETVDLVNGCIAKLEQHYGGSPPSTLDGWQVYNECPKAFEGFEDRFYVLQEDLRALIVAHALTSPEQIKFMTEESEFSFWARDILASIGLNHSRCT